MTVKKEILQNLRASQADIVARLDEIEKNREIYPLWTVRELVAHLSGWDDSAIAFLNAVLHGEMPPTPAKRGIDMYNAETVSTREGLSYDHIIREYHATRDKLIELIESATDEALTTTSTLPWGGAGTFEGIAGVWHEHELKHAEDIRKFIEGHNSK